MVSLGCLILADTLRQSGEELNAAAARRTLMPAYRLDSEDGRSFFDATAASNLGQRMDYSPVFVDPLEQNFEQPARQYLLEWVSNLTHLYTLRALLKHDEKFGLRTDALCFFQGACAGLLCSNCSQEHNSLCGILLGASSSKFLIPLNTLLRSNWVSNRHRQISFVTIS